MIPSPQSLAVFERFAFIADHTRDAVLRADRYDWSSDVTIRLPVTEVEPKGVSVYHSSQQPSGKEITLIIIVTSKSYTCDAHLSTKQGSHGR